MAIVMKHNSTVKVKTSGVLEIPKAILAAIAAAPGERFKVERDGFGLRLVPDPALPKKTVDQVAGCLRASSGKQRSDAETAQDIGALIRAQDEATKGR
jgi:bifunctional DNA-binding transcriptional regulator/antitoxin component of YhaV-PrlF toxin-antitoxin module